ncbi:hypothetical protein VN12_23515 [Pirellula sp. SH-Sr6A]|nr:hypothetical protein VN12_23515 [Pirellula sp. SH-Sr6A]
MQDEPDTIQDCDDLTALEWVVYCVLLLLFVVSAFYVAIEVDNAICFRWVTNEWWCGPRHLANNARSIGIGLLVTAVPLILIFGYLANNWALRLAAFMRKSRDRR